MSASLNWPEERPSFLVGRVPFKRSQTSRDIPSECWVCFAQIRWGREVFHARGAHDERAFAMEENWDFTTEEWEQLARELGGLLSAP